MLILNLVLFSLYCPLSSSGWKLWCSLFPAPSQGCPLYSVLLYPAAEPGAGLRGEESVSQYGDQRYLQPGRVHTEWTHANTAVTVGWVSTTVMFELLYFQRFYDDVYEYCRVTLTPRAVEQNV